MAITFSIGAEETHKIGEMGAKRIRTWLDATYRFKIQQSVYDLDPQGVPYPKLRVPLLADGRYERFDLIGTLLDLNGAPGRMLYVECKNYSSAGDQASLYDEYLAVCYSAFAKMSQLVGAPADIEFMWATTHPFAVTNYVNLTTEPQIRSACTRHAGRLGGQAYDESTARQLERRLWLAIVNPRVEEMVMGTELQKAVVSRIKELELAT
jgi:hypothetical protein